MIRVNDGFMTESGYDFIMFEDSNSGSGMFITYKFHKLPVADVGGCPSFKILNQKLLKTFNLIVLYL